MTSRIRVEMHHRAKFRQNQSNSCGHRAVFQDGHLAFVGHILEYLEIFIIWNLFVESI